MYANPILGSWQPRRQAKTKAGFAIRVRKPSNRGMHTSRWEDFQGEGQPNYQRALIGGLGSESKLKGGTITAAVGKGAKATGRCERY
jgi:hypothetical protein